MDGDGPSSMQLKLNPQDLTPKVGTTAYPPDLRSTTAGREKKALGDFFGLSQFGVNQTVLVPDSASALRHWHAEEDEFVYIISGELTLVTDEGETILSAGECAGFPAGRPNGHVLVNRSSEPASYLEIGTRSQKDEVTFPDDDLHATKTGGVYTFTRKDVSAV